MATNPPGRTSSPTPDAKIAFLPRHVKEFIASAAMPAAEFFGRLTILPACSTMPGGYVADMPHAAV